MELLNNLYIGFSTLFNNPMSIAYIFIGVLMGVFIGVLPGIGASAGLALMLPLLFGMHPLSGIVMMTGLYYGAMYGSAITSILINVPGDSASVTTTFDGYKMTAAGRGGPALGMAAYASVIGGTVSVMGFMYFAPVIAGFAVAFGPAEYLALMILALTSLAGLTGKSITKGFLSAFVGLFIASIGLDLVIGMPRYTFGIPNLFGGISFIPVVMGLFGIAEILSVKDVSGSVSINKEDLKFKNLFPTKQDWKDSAPHLARSSVLGFFIGVLPGAGATIASFMSYDLAKRTSKHGDKFGVAPGRIEGVVASECASSSTAIGSLIPMFTLGIPGSGTTAVMLGALLMFGLSPGPSFFENHADLAWGLVASMYVGNVFLLFLGVFGLPVFVKVLELKMPILNSLVMGFILLGAFGLNNSMFDVGLTIFFGAIGYLMKQFEVPPAPMVLAIVLGEITERNLRLAMILSHGSVMAIVTRPIVSVILAITFLVIFGVPIKNAVVNLLARRKGGQ